MLLTNRGEVIIKVEGTPYTAETLSDADHNIRINGIPEWSINVAEYQRKILDGTYDAWTSVMGKRSAQVTIRCDLTPGATVTTIPEFGKLLRISGWKETGWSGGTEVAVGSAVEGISYRPHAEYTHVPGTIDIQEIKEGVSADMLVTKMKGCMAACKIMIGTVGEPVGLVLTISGSLVSITDRAFAAKLDPTSMSTIVPPALMGITTFSLGGVAQDIDSFEIDDGNDVAESPDPTAVGGINGYYIGNRRMTMKMDPTLKLIAEEDFWGDLTGETTGALSIVLGSTPALSMSGPALQNISHEFPDRNGAILNSKTLLFTSNEGQSPNNIFEILQGAKT